MSKFVLEKGKLEGRDISGQTLNIPDGNWEKFDVTWKNEAFLMILIDSRKAQKFTVIRQNDNFHLNHNLGIPLLAENVTDVKISGKKLNLVRNGDKVVALDIDECDKYATCAQCFAIGDLTCGKGLKICINIKIIRKFRKFKTTVCKNCIFCSDFGSN